MHKIVILSRSVFNKNHDYYYYKLYYDRANLSEVIDVNKTSTAKKGVIYHNQNFLDKGFKFQSSVCNGYHDVLMMSIDINSIAILNIHGIDYRCIFFGISKKP